jgi:SecD/SecF fusion protein
VDANVLIYERLREELQTGKNLTTALHAAYDRAFSAIFDGHMTSIITGIILFWMASGTVKGFAVSLTIGLLASLFGSLLVTRTLFSYFPNLKALSFLDLIKNRSFDFMGKARTWIMISVVTVIITAVAWGWKRGDGLGPDLRGGDQIQILVEKDNAGLNVNEVERIAKTVDASANVQEKSRPAGGASFIVVKTDEGKGDPTLAELRKVTGKALIEGVTSSNIGSQVGAKMLWQSGWALVVGLIAILLYLASSSPSPSGRLWPWFTT